MSVPGQQQSSEEELGLGAGAQAVNRKHVCIRGEREAEAPLVNMPGLGAERCNHLLGALTGHQQSGETLPRVYVRRDALVLCFQRSP